MAQSRSLMAASQRLRTESGRAGVVRGDAVGFSTHTVFARFSLLAPPPPAASLPKQPGATPSALSVHWPLGFSVSAQPSIVHQSAYALGKPTFCPSLGLLRLLALLPPSTPPSSGGCLLGAQGLSAAAAAAAIWSLGLVAELLLADTSPGP